MKIKGISNRLMSAVEFVNEGACFADIGTDHGYLPIYLYKKGKIKKAVASDINRGPLESAKKNIVENGASEGIETVLSDGLEKIEKYSPDHIAIFGMGGELVCRIIENAPWVKNPKIRLIIQPMTKQAETRKYLLDNGFSIVGEAISVDDEKIYQTICAEYCGQTEEYTEIQLLLGKKNIEKGGEFFYKLAECKLAIYKSRLEGMKKAGLGENEERILAELEKFVREKKYDNKRTL